MVFKVSAFKEKPNLETALSYLETGNYVWNSGMFIWSTKIIKSAFEKYMPQQAKQFDSEVYYSDKERGFINKVYPNAEKEFIDFGIMEKANNVFVVDAKFTWSDLGTCKSVFVNSEKDNNDNFVIGKNVSTYQSSKNIINIQNSKKVVIDGLKDYIIVDTEESLLICPKENEQKIKEYVSRIQINKQYQFNTKTHPLQISFALGVFLFILLYKLSIYSFATSKASSDTLLSLKYCPIISP